MLSLSSHENVRVKESLKVLANYKSEDTERIACLFLSNTCNGICENRGWTIELQNQKTPHTITIGFEEVNDAVMFKLLEDFTYIH